MVKIENLVAPLRIKTESDSQLKLRYFEQTENQHDLKFKSSSGQNSFNAELAVTNSQKTSNIDSGEKFLPNFEILSFIKPEQESGTEEMGNSGSLSNLPSSIANDAKTKTTILATHSFLDKSSFDTHDASKSIKTECNPAPLLKVVKMEENVSNLDNLPKALTPATNSFSLSSYGIKPCWVVLERLEIIKADGNMASNLSSSGNKMTFSDATHDSKAYGNVNHKAQNNTIQGIVTCDKTRDGTTYVEVHDNNEGHGATRDNSMTRESVADFLKHETLCVIDQIVPLCRIKLEQHDKPLRPSSSSKLHRTLLPDNNAVKRETSPLVAPPADCQTELEKEELSSFSSSFEASDDNNLRDDLICDYEFHDISGVKRETSFLFTPLFSDCQTKLEKEECPSILSSMARHDYEMHNNMICDNKAHENNAVKRETFPLVAKCQTKLKEEQCLGLPLSSEACHDIIAVKRETSLLVPPFLLADRTKVEVECSSLPSFAKVCYDKNALEREPSLLAARISNGIEVEKEYVSPPSPSEVCYDKKIRANVIHDSNAIKCGTSLPVSNGQIKIEEAARERVEKEEVVEVEVEKREVYEETLEKKVEKEENRSSVPSSSKVCHDSKSHDNMIRDTKEHDGTICGMSEFHCKLCNTSFARKEYLKRHIEYHCDESPLVTSVKNVSFHGNTDPRHGYVNRNARRTDGLEEKRPQCKDCEKYFSRPDVLKKHIKIVHLRVKDKAKGMLDPSKKAIKIEHLKSKEKDNAIPDALGKQNANVRPKIKASAPSVALKKYVKSVPPKLKCKTKLNADASAKHIGKVLTRSEDEIKAFSNSETKEVEIMPPRPKDQNKAITCGLNKDVQEVSLRQENKKHATRVRTKPKGKTKAITDASEKHDVKLHFSPKNETKATVSEESEIMFSCHHCEKSFSTESGLKNHLSYYRKNFDLQRVCNVCNASFSDSFRFNRHMRWAHVRVPVKIGKCEGCGKVLSRVSYLNKHLRRQGINNDNFFALVPSEAFDRLTCQFCEKVFSKVEFLKCHLLRRFQKSAQVCQLCCVFFEDIEVLRRHLESVHQIKSEQAVCGSLPSDCDKTKASIDYTCDQCGKSFKRKGFLEIHIVRRCAFVKVSGRVVDSQKHFQNVGLG